MNNATIMYHYIRDWNYPSFSKRELGQQIEHLLESRRNVSVKELLEKPNGKTFTLTFDDGLKDGVTNALPVLEKAGVKGIFFVPMRLFAERKIMGVQKRHLLLEKLGVKKFAKEFNFFVEDDLFAIVDEGGVHCFDSGLMANLKQVLDLLLKEVSEKTLDVMFENHFDEGKEFDKMHLSKEDFVELREAGMEVGVHGYDHCYLDRLPPKVMREELSKAANLFRQMFPDDLLSISYPSGGHNVLVKRVMRELGFVAGFTTDRMFNTDLSNPYEICRFDCVDFYPRKEACK